MFKKELFLIIFSLVSGIMFSQDVIVDESYMDDGFRQFKSKLACAVLSKDSLALISLLDHHIGNGMMDYYLDREFFDRNDHTWRRLDRVLKYGFHIGHGETKASLKDSLNFTAPSYLKAIHIQREAGENNIVILAKNLNVRAMPGIDSKIISKLSYQLAEPLFDEDFEIIEILRDEIIWLKIQLPNDQVGFIAKKYTSEYQYDTLVVSKKAGVWKITAFYGDTRSW